MLVLLFFGIAEKENGLNIEYYYLNLLLLKI